MSKSTNIPQSKDASMYPEPRSNPVNTLRMSRMSYADVARMAHANDDSRHVTSSNSVAVSYPPSRNSAPRHADRAVQVSPRISVTLVVVVLTIALRCSLQSVQATHKVFPHNLYPPPACHLAFSVHLDMYRIHEHPKRLVVALLQCVLERENCWKGIINHWHPQV